MKKLLSLALVICLVLICGTASAEWMMVRITAKCADTNHVGASWYGVYSMGGAELRDGDIVDLVEGTYDFTTQIYDSDAKPDVGEATDSCKVTANKLNKGFSVSQYLTVTEDRGYYKNYWCEWYITYEFEPVTGWEVIIH